MPKFTSAYLSFSSEIYSQPCTTDITTKNHYASDLYPPTALLLSLLNNILITKLCKHITMEMGFAASSSSPASSVSVGITPHAKVTRRT